MKLPVMWCVGSRNMSVYVIDVKKTLRFKKNVKNIKNVSRRFLNVTRIKKTFVNVE